jgi:hypothetical protein
MTTISREIVDAILSKDNINANEKIYDALYGKSSEELQARKVQIAKHFFDPESVNDQGTEVNLNDEDSEDPEETSEQ